MAGYFEILAEAAGSRSRSSWNDRLAHWERPASDTEEQRIERAASAARSIIGNSKILSDAQVIVQPQGSYFNNTNVRREADMDLRVQLPSIYTEYAPGVSAVQADQSFGYVSTDKSIREEVDLVRNELARIAKEYFGRDNVEVGNKAITVSGLDRYADVDLVPALRRHYIFEEGGEFYRMEGVAIIGTDGKITKNYPKQHHDNGIAKRTATKLRFKKVVRMLKRLNGELAELKLIEKCMPSFFVECLVYCVENDYFKFDEDRYMLLNRVLARLQVLLDDESWVESATEINEIKYLFRYTQPWTADSARSFVAAALGRLEA